MSLALTNKPTVVDRFIKKSLTADIALVLSGTTLTAIAAQMSIPNQPVPFTFQTLAVLMVGSTLGTVRAALSLTLYAVIGAFGLPVFTAQAHGVEYLFGATGGYIFGFILAAALVGFLAERGWSNNSIGMVGSYLIGSAIIYSIGATWLTYGYLAGDWQKGLALGVIPFLIWDAVKAFIAAAIVPEAWRIANKIRNK
jgi:biotin transport system substrate-specific component